MVHTTCICDVASTTTASTLRRCHDPKGPKNQMAHHRADRPPTTSYPPLLQQSSSNVTLSNGALQRLQSGLKKCRLEVPQEHVEFIPRSEVQRLVDESVEDVLLEESIASSESIQRLSRIIRGQLPKLFAVLVVLKKVDFITEFIDEGINDEDLPFVQAPSSNSRCPTPALLTSQKKPIRTLQSWDPQSIKQLKRKQYQVLSPIFRQGEHYELDGLHILPFIEEDTEEVYKPAAAGGYGEVSRQCIHPDHHEFKTPTAGDALVVAVKRMFREADFVLEEKVYRELGPLRHRHLIELLFSFKKKDGYHLVFPWADGTLKDYWERNPDLNFSRDLLLWSLEQMAGIADGLASFHEFTNPAHGITQFGRHGDIKAQNILWFSNANVLKIADLGLASVRGRDSRSNVHPNTVIESPTYSPPEKQRMHLVSRKWDIWSLGCLYLEFVTYLVLGNAAIEEFSKEREDATSEIPELLSDEFYSADHESVKPSVISWVANLKQRPRCSGLIHDILDLVMEKMILVDPSSRSTSAHICNILNEKLQQAKESDKYLFEQRAGVLMGPINVTFPSGPASQPPMSLHLRVAQHMPARKGVAGLMERSTY
ncbi:kinase-like domain-containing protein [Aspergillus desertorum]